MNDSPKELDALKQAATLIDPDAIQLNSLDRQAPFPGVHPVSREDLQHIREFFRPLLVQLVPQRKRSGLPPWSDPELIREILKTAEAGPIHPEPPVGGDRHS